MEFLVFLQKHFENMIKNLIFDFGKVLVTYDFNYIVDTFFDDSVELAEFKKVIIDSGFIDQCDKEDIPFRELILQKQQEYPQWREPLEMFYNRYLDFVIGEVPGMRDILLKYRAKGYRLYGLTNWCSVVHQVIEKFDILQLLDDRIISSEEHLIKPYSPIYQRLLDKFGLKAEECVFTDDKAVNIDGAKSVGMNAILFKDAVQYETELQSYLETPVLNDHNKDEYAPAHTAEHLLNQTMIRMFGCERSRNAHIERKKSKINYNLSFCPDTAIIAEIERRMNELIAEELPVSYEFVTRDNIPDGVVLDKLPEDASETLRIVRIGNYDTCACIGKHVASTSEIGSFKITSTSFKDGSFRIVYKVNQ